MTANEKLSGLIRPFNRDPEAYQAMCAEKPPKDLTMVLSLLYHTDRGMCGGPFYGPAPWFEHDPVGVLTTLAEKCIANSPFPEMRCEVILASEDDSSARFTDVIKPGELQNAWVTHGDYPQVHFCDDSGSWLIESHAPFHTAMTVDDAMYELSHSLDPTQHLPLAVSHEQEVAFRVIVGDFYNVRLGVWCDALRQLRNEVLVKFHATVINEEDDDPRKPDEEWAKFQAAGFKHFLDYTKLLQA